MTAQAIQLRKEARQLLWPWFAVTMGGLLLLVYSSRTGSTWSPIDNLLPMILPVCCLLGIPLLATLPLGSEFQFGTLSLLLAQPLDRRKLWLQKLAVAVAAVLPPAVIFLFLARDYNDFGMDLWVVAAWMFATTAAAIVWTLIARSTMGAVTLSTGFHTILFVGCLRLAERVNANTTSRSFAWMTTVMLFAYAAGMITLGRRMFLRFQATEGVLGNEALAPMARFFPRIGLDWLRSRPRGAILNLFRREIHLLRIVWLLSLFTVAAWICLLAFRVVKPKDSWDDNPAILLTVLLSFLIALLAGALSLGEEKTRGTHAWHLTLPLSASWQWFVKLSVALFVSIVCAVGIPFGVLFARGWLAGAPFSYLAGPPVWIWVLEALFTTLLAFWCSCVVKGTIRAVLYVFPMFFAMGLAFTSGNQLAYKVMHHADGFLTAAASACDLFRLNHTLTIVANPKDSFHIALSLVLAPLLAIGLIQSLRLFRGRAEDHKFHTVRCALKPIATFFATSFTLALFFLFAHRLGLQQKQVLQEANQAIQALESGGSTDAAKVHRFTIEDLDRAHRLSDRAKHWLRGSTILVTVRAASDTDRPPRIEWPYESAYVDSGVRGKIVRPYSATVRTAGGLECNLNFWATGQNQWEILTEVCQ